MMPLRLNAFYPDFFYVADRGYIGGRVALYHQQIGAAACFDAASVAEAESVGGEACGAS
jgi:hypothetical protein